MDAKKIKITGQPTLDPFVCKFIVDYPILSEGSLICRNEETAYGSPLLELLFAIPGVREILVVGNILTIAKEGLEAWPEIGEKIGEAIRTAIGSGNQLIHSSAKKKLPSEEHIRQTIEKLFETEINPSIASHGGKVELADVEGTSVYLRLGGGCQGCSSASVTLKQGIEKAIRVAIPEVTDIQDVTDHAAGTDPYYN